MNSTFFKTLSLVMSVFVFSAYASEGQWSLKNVAREAAYSCCLNLNDPENPAVPLAAMGSAAIATRLECDYFGIEMTEQNLPVIQASVVGKSILLLIGANKIVNYACNRLAISCAMDAEKKKAE